MVARKHLFSKLPSCCIQLGS